jgi:hypothetical protein
MLKKYSILGGIIISLSLLAVATRYYPGGSQFDKNTVGYIFTKNYLCNLFGETAVNGLPSASRPWAIAGMLVFCATCALFFIEFSKKIPQKRASTIIKYFGAGAMLFAFFAVTPLHDIVITIGGTMALISMFYITVFILKSKLHLLKILSVICLLGFYTCNYSYYTSSYLEFLPVLQKVMMGLVVVWVLWLHYFTTINDFKQLLPDEKKR